MQAWKAKLLVKCIIAYNLSAHPATRCLQFCISGTIYNPAACSSAQHEGPGFINLLPQWHPHTPWTPAFSPSHFLLMALDPCSGLIQVQPRWHSLHSALDLCLHHHHGDVQPRQTLGMSSQLSYISVVLHILHHESQCFAVPLLKPSPQAWHPQLRIKMSWQL